MKSTTYINVVLKRVVDDAAFQLRSMIENFVTGEMVTEIVNTIISRGDDIDYLFQTSPSMNADKEKIENNIALLLETKKHIIKVIDRPLLCDVADYNVNLRGIFQMLTQLLQLVVIVNIEEDDMQ
nr:hypothetical protein [Tanacetum cinerariifolium]